MSFSKDNPDKSTGYWCANCGSDLRFNVPRMGAAGGFIHARTNSLRCEPPFIPTITTPNPITTLEQANNAANAIIAQQADEMKRLQDELNEARANTQKLVELLAVARCPECDGSEMVVSHVHADEYVSRDMAMDAGDPSMEGSIYRVGEPEFSQCRWCDERRTALAAQRKET